MGADVDVSETAMANDVAESAGAMLKDKKIVPALHGSDSLQEVTTHAHATTPAATPRNLQTRCICSASLPIGAVRYHGLSMVDGEIRVYDCRNDARRAACGAAAAIVSPLLFWSVLVSCGGSETAGFGAASRDASAGDGLVDVDGVSPGTDAAHDLFGAAPLDLAVPDLASEDRGDVAPTDAGASDGGEPPVPTFGVAQGYYHGCAWKRGGRVFCWGQNQQGQLGAGHRDRSTKAVEVRGLPAIIQVAVGGTARELLGHTCALTDAGSVFCWGDNQFGQLGDGTADDRLSPVQVRGLADVVQLALGSQHSCAITRGGIAYCWGGNSAAQLGDGTVDDAREPRMVKSLADAVEIAAGGGHSCARRRSGALDCWGSNAWGTLGDGKSGTAFKPSPVAVLRDVSDVALAINHSCAIEAGQLFCWGNGEYGLRGDGSFVQTQRTPVAAVRMPIALGKLVALGDGLAACALGETGAIACWGNYIDDDDVSVRNAEPYLVPAIGDPVAAIGGRCVVTAAGAVFCWGPNDGGQAAPGSTARSLFTPAKVADITF